MNSKVEPENCEYYRADTLDHVTYYTASQIEDVLKMKQTAKVAKKNAIRRNAKSSAPLKSRGEAPDVKFFGDYKMSSRPIGDQEVVEVTV